MKAKVLVTRKKSIADPEGHAVQKALTQLGFDQVKNVRVGKIIEVELDQQSVHSSKEQLQQMCEKLLANPVMENFEIEMQS